MCLGLCEPADLRNKSHMTKSTICELSDPTSSCEDEDVERIRRESHEHRKAYLGLLERARRQGNGRIRLGPLLGEDGEVLFDKAAFVYLNLPKSPDKRLVEQLADSVFFILNTMLLKPLPALLGETRREVLA